MDNPEKFHEIEVYCKPDWIVSPVRTGKMYRGYAAAVEAAEYISTHGVWVGLGTLIPSRDIEYIYVFELPRQRKKDEN